MQGKKLINGIKRTIYLNQPIELSINGLRATFTSADKYRLAEYLGSLASNSFKEEKVFIISPQSAKEIIERVDKEEKVIITANDKSLTFTGKKYTLTVDLLKNKSINYKIPDAFNLEIELEREKLLGALDIFVKERSYRNEYGEYARVRLIPFDDVLLISTLSEESPFIDDDKTRTFMMKIKTKYDYITNEEFFSYLEIYFNEKFLRDAIEPISSDIISLKFINEYSPVVITSADDNNKNYLAVVMPMSPVFDANKQLKLMQTV
jgi:DNA polymerase III sliding clamp (beta) subunit (PCNA family)